MTLSDSRPGRRLTATLRPLPSPQTGLPRLPGSPFRRAVPTTPADRAGALSVASPSRAAFPVMQAGRHPQLHFRGLLRLHSRYGPPDRSAAQGGLCHEASTQPVTRPSRSSATRLSTTIWVDPPPLVIRAFGAHREIRGSLRSAELFPDCASLHPGYDSFSSAGPAPRGRCARHIPYSRRHTDGCLPASAPARGWRAPPENADHARRTAWCPRTRTAH